MARYKTIEEDIAESRQMRQDSSPESILAIIEKFGAKKAAGFISMMMRNQQSLCKKRGILAACAYVEGYDDLSSHPFKISDCVMSKLDVTNRKPRGNSGILETHIIERVSSKTQNIFDLLSLEPNQFSDAKYPIELKAGKVYRITVSRIKKNKAQIK